jgi:hypothetical protein
LRIDVQQYRTYWEGFRIIYQENVNITSTFNNSGVLFDLPAPALDISFGFAASGVYPGTSSRDRSTTLLTSGPNTNDSYDAAYLEANGSCQSINSYRWGFSFLFLFISILLTVLWAVGMHIMWLDAYFESHHDRNHRSMGTHRAAIDFALAIIKDMGCEIPPEHVSEKELVLRRRKALNGGKVPRLNPASIHREDDNAKLQTRAEELLEWLFRRRWARILKRCMWVWIMLLPLGVVAAIGFFVMHSNNHR